MIVRKSVLDTVGIEILPSLIQLMLVVLSINSESELVFPSPFLCFLSYPHTSYGRLGSNSAFTGQKANFGRCVCTSSELS